MKDISSLTREELLENINSTLGLLNKFTGIRYRIEGYYDSVPGIYEKIIVIAAFVLIIPIIMIEAEILGAIFGFFGSILGFILGLATTGVLAFIAKKKVDTNFERKQEAYREENRETLDRLNLELGQVADEVFQTTYIPEDYVTKQALETFSRYLSSYRANTLTECINLYETELQAQQMRDEINNLRQEQQVTNQMLKNAQYELQNTNRNLREVNSNLKNIGNEVYKSNYWR